MKTPRYTDKGRYPNGYRRSVETDITRTWARANKRIEENKQEREKVVTKIKAYGTHGK